MEDDDAGALGEVHELDMEDDIDLLSEGAMEREIMMDQIKSSDIFTLEEFNKYNLTVFDLLLTLSARVNASLKSSNF